MSIINPAAQAMSLDELSETTIRLKATGLRIVLTTGCFDLFHLGHLKSLGAAKELADILVVGVDSDARIRWREKGHGRPIVPEAERVALVAWQRPTGLVYLMSADPDEYWALVRAVRPDVLVTSVEHARSKTLQAMGELAGRVEVLERQSEITTSERIRHIYNVRSESSEGSVRLAG
jgi:cytidyltransferase-like protein